MQQQSVRGENMQQQSVRGENMQQQSYREENMRQQSYREENMRYHEVIMTEEIGLDEWLLEILNSKTCIHLRWGRYPSDRLFVMVKLKSITNQLKHIKYNYIIKYAKYKHKSSTPHLMSEPDLEKIFDELVAELRNCSWCRYVSIEDKTDRQIYQFQITRQIMTSSEKQIRREQSASNRPPASLMVQSNWQSTLNHNNQHPEMSLPLPYNFGNPTAAQGLHQLSNFNQRDQPINTMGGHHPESSGTSGGSRTSGGSPTNQSLNPGISLSPALPSSGSTTTGVTWQQYCQRKNISRDTLKRFEVRVFVSGRMVIDQSNMSLMNDGFQIFYGNPDQIRSIIQQHEPEIADLLRHVGFNRAKIEPFFIIERDVKGALDAFVCGGVLFKYNDADDSVVLYRFSQTRVYVESHLHERAQKLERFCRANPRESPTVVFSYPKYVVEGRRSSKHITLNIGSSKIKVELTPPKELDSFAADHPVDNPSRRGSSMLPQPAFVQPTPHNSDAILRPHDEHASFTMYVRRGSLR